MITVEKIGKGTYFEDAFKLSFKYDPVTVGKVKELAQRRYLPEERAWEIPAFELPNLVDKVGINNIKSEEAVLDLPPKVHHTEYVIVIVPLFDVGFIVDKSQYVSREKRARKNHIFKAFDGRL